MWRRWRVLVTILAVLAGCSGGPGDSTALPDLTITAIGPTPVVSGTRLIIEGTGFVPDVLAKTYVTFNGKLSGVGVSLQVPAVRIDESRIYVEVTGTVASALVKPGGRFEGVVQVDRVASNGYEDSVAVTYAFDTAEALIPTASFVAPTELYPGDKITITGSNFLQTGEGLSLIQLDGEFRTEFPVEVTVIEELVLPVSLVDELRRDLAAFELTPDILGIRPGKFKGTLTAINQTYDSAPVTAQPLAVDQLSLGRPFIDVVYPLEASRGQSITVRGRGFLPSDGLFQSASLVIFEGIFTPNRGAAQEWTAVDAVALYPSSAVGNTELRFVLRPELTLDGKVSGFGVEPGVFDGTITPILLSGQSTVSGNPFSLKFKVKAPLQMVYLKLLPAFDQALDEFGLLIEKQAIITRMKQVVERDYQGINVGFTFDYPEDYQEFAVVEIGAYDPNGSNLFGLDNTAGKDVGNLRFDDVVGGFNADTRASNSAAYGGVFVAEFLNLSAAFSGSPLSSPRFDEIFASFVPALGGTPASPGEASNTSIRGAMVMEAIRVLGNLIGNTVSHEVGHTLGLAAIDGQFHNIGDNPGWIMDAGSFRSFEERAEIGGQGPAKFSPFNRTYLESILPVDP